MSALVFRSRTNAVISGSGQALIEFSVSALVLITASAGGFALLKTQWNRFRCLRDSFEAAHAAQIDAPAPRPLGSARFQMNEDAESVESVAICGPLTEKVKLPRLLRREASP